MKSLQRIMMMTLGFCLMAGSVHAELQVIDAEAPGEPALTPVDGVYTIITNQRVEVKPNFSYTQGYVQGNVDLGDGRAFDMNIAKNQSSGLPFSFNTSYAQPGIYTITIKRPEPDAAITLQFKVLERSAPAPTAPATAAVGMVNAAELVPAIIPTRTASATTPAEVTPSQEEVANAQAEAASKAVEVAQNALTQAIAPIKAAEAALKNATTQRDTAERDLTNNQKAQVAQKKISDALRKQRKNKEADDADAAASKKVTAAQQNLDSKKAEFEKQTKNLAAVKKQQQPVIENAQKEVAAAQNDYKKYSSQRAVLQ